MRSARVPASAREQGGGPASRRRRPTSSAGACRKKNRLGSRSRPPPSRPPAFPPPAPHGARVRGAGWRHRKLADRVHRGPRARPGDHAVRARLLCTGLAGAARALRRRSRPRLAGPAQVRCRRAPARLRNVALARPRHALRAGCHHDRAGSALNAQSGPGARSHGDC